MLLDRKYYCRCIFEKVNLSKSHIRKYQEKFSILQMVIYFLQIAFH